MSQPMIVWCVIVGALLFAFLLRAIGQHHSKCLHESHRARHLFEMGKEREIFYIPGDSDDDDFDD